MGQKQVKKVVCAGVVFALLCLVPTGCGGQSDHPEGDDPKKEQTTSPDVTPGVPKKESGTKTEHPKDEHPRGEHPR